MFSIFLVHHEENIEVEEQIFPFHHFPVASLIFSFAVAAAAALSQKHRSVISLSTQAIVERYRDQSTALFLNSGLGP